LEPHRTTNVLGPFTDRLAGAEIGHEPGVVLSRVAGPIPESWLPPEGATVELFDGERCEGEPIEVLTGRRLFNVWFAESYPAGVDSLSVRLTVTVTPDVSGRHRLNALGFGHAVLTIDGEQVADNQDNGFGAGLGRHAGDGFFTFEAGRSYEMVLDHTPVRAGQFIVITDIGAELDDVDPEAMLVAAEQAAAAADVAVVVVGSTAEWESEGGDRELMMLPAGQDDLVRRVAAANPNCVVVLNCGAPMELPWLDDVGACLLVWYPGQEAGETITDLLLGAAEPSGRMPTTWPRSMTDTPVVDSYPGTDLVMSYDEGVFVGYRWYDREGIEPLIPFGHGGSYTSFEWGDDVMWTDTADSASMSLGIDVVNSGDRAGSDVVQVYVAPVDPVAERPVKELAGFAKVTLEPGQAERVWVTLRDRAFARWDVDTHDWVVDPGTYELVVARSVTDEHARVPVER
ncbi:MAG: glycoside hydrolase family 3 C-terminal domain-containing protein, partial [Acidimicrobiales bacterium]